ncbi:UDP-N-acetylmuramoyl-tripeptide--D-alanyl-D-alanine ligase [Spirochaetota bacterium]
MKVHYNSTVRNIRKIIKGKKIKGKEDLIIDTITTDSRQLGSNNLFIPIVGEKFDGHDFIKELSEGSKVNCFLSMKDGYENFAGDDIALIRCDDTLKAYGMIAQKHREEVNPRVVGITGTNGKTTTKELVFSILKEKHSTLRNEKNYNNEIGVPFTLLGLNEGHEVAVIEMGMNHAGELDRLSRMSRPDISLITNIGEGHIEFFDTVENVARAKSEILNGMSRGSVVLINRDTESFDLLLEKSKSLGLSVKTFGINDNADIYPREYHLSANGIELFYGGEKIWAPLYGIHNVYNLLGAIAVALEFNIELETINKSLSTFENVSGRSQVIDRGFIVVNDTYNSNPLSSKYALSSVREIFPERRKIAVLSDMKELGEKWESYHFETGKLVGEYGFHMLCAWGEMSKTYIEGAKKTGMDSENLLYFESKVKMIDFLKSKVNRDDVILVKGSRSMKMEEVVNSLITGGE